LEQTGNLPLRGFSSRNSAIWWVTAEMKRDSRRRFLPVQLDEQRFAGLERVLRGADPQLAPERAAEVLATCRKGRALLLQLIGSREPPRLRQSAAYGFVFGPLDASEFNFLLRRFDDTTEDPGVRGQIAEAIGPRVVFNDQARRKRRRDWVARAAFQRGLDDPSPVVRFWSIFALARRGNGWAIPKLETMRKDLSFIPGMWTVGQEAGWAIHWIRGQEVDPHTL
jgi:hypothetical protein